MISGWTPEAKQRRDGLIRRVDGRALARECDCQCYQQKASEEGIVPLQDLVKLFSGNYFRRRMDQDWVSHSREYAREMVATLKEIGKAGPFWLGPKS